MKYGPMTLMTVLLVAGCATTIPMINRNEPRFAGLSETELEELDRGRIEYIAKCSGCHQLYRPRSGDSSYWNEWVDDMEKRSHLDPDEKRRIKAYLLIQRKGTDLFSGGHPLISGNFTGK